jgi:hypothetical protein
MHPSRHRDSSPSKSVSLTRNRVWENSPYHWPSSTEVISNYAFMEKALWQYTCPLAD